ncbi:mitochondrial glutamate carrier 1 [Ciona intestinalis]
MCDMEMEFQARDNLIKYQTLIATTGNGCIAGFAGIVATFPLDLCKTRLQNQPVHNGVRMYNGLWHCMIEVQRKEGMRGLYRGSLPNLICIMPEKAIKLGMNDYVRGFFHDGSSIKLRHEILAGAVAGLCQSVITIPMEMFKISGQDATRVNAGAVVSYRNTLQIVRQTRGLSGIYSGGLATWLRDIPFSMIYFPLYSYLTKVLWQKDSQKAPFWVNLVSAMTAAGFAAVAVNPFDVIKTRLQSIHHSRKYTGIVDCGRSIYKEEGFKSFFRGSAPRCMAIAPLFGIAQSVYRLGVCQGILGIPHNPHV